MTEFITAPSLGHSSIKHAFFTRQGGVSEGEFVSLNVGYGSNDRKKQVRKNRARIATTLESSYDDILNCHQTHSNICHIAHGMNDEPLEGDALVTNVPGLAISVLTADCVPVLFADTKAGIVGAAHAGWKGTQAGIIENTLNAMEQIGAQKTNITAAIGPAIAQTSYEVTTEFMHAFCVNDSSLDAFFIAGKDEAHRQFDLPGLVLQQLGRLGVAKAEKLNYDTYADEERFYSYRRSTHQQQSQYGRLCSAIMIK